MTEKTNTPPPNKKYNCNTNNQSNSSPEQAQGVQRSENYGSDAATHSGAEERRLLKAEMAELCANLKHELENPDPWGSALERQVVVLDRLLYAVMRRALKDDIENGDFNPKHLNKALRIQKQSMDGYKAFYTIDYMQAIMDRRAKTILTPSPRYRPEQSEEPWIPEE